MIVRRPSRFGELMSLRQAMDRLFDDDFFRPLWTIGERPGVALPLDVSTTPDAFVVEASLPGVKPEDVEITVENDTLTISGRTAAERKVEEASYVFSEIRHGSFSRTVSLPTGLETDEASATFENGVLSLRIPKAERVKPRQIRISPVTEGNGRDASDRPDEPKA